MSSTTDTFNLPTPLLPNLPCCINSIYMGLEGAALSLLWGRHMYYRSIYLSTYLKSTCICIPTYRNFCIHLCTLFGYHTFGIGLYWIALHAIALYYHDGVCICMYMYMYIYIQIHTYVRTYIHTYMHAEARAKRAAAPQTASLSADLWGLGLRTVWRILKY